MNRELIPATKLVSAEGALERRGGMVRAPHVVVLFLGRGKRGGTSGAGNDAMGAAEVTGQRAFRDEGLGAGGTFVRFGGGFPNFGEPGKGNGKHLFAQFLRWF